MRAKLSFPRQIGLKRQKCLDYDTFTSYLSKLNGMSNIYTSLYSFDDLTDYDSVVIDRAWWDFDTNEDYDMETVKNDVATLLSRLEGEVRLVATGRGFHVHQFFKRPVRGRQWALHLDRYERKMAEGLISLDGVGYPEKLTRVSNTYNVTRNRWCVVIDHNGFSEDPMGYKIPNRPQPTLEHLDPFTGDFNADSCFDLVMWNNENPFVDRIPSTQRATVKVGNHNGEVALPTCLDRAIRVSNPPHHVRVALVQEMSRQLRWYADPRDLSQEEKDEIADNICDFIEALDWIDYHPNITKKYVVGMQNYRNAPSPFWYRKHNLCNGEDCWYCS
jgi:hypothetical protein